MQDFLPVCRRCAEHSHTSVWVLVCVTIERKKTLFKAKYSLYVMEVHGCHLCRLDWGLKCPEISTKDSWRAQIFGSIICFQFSIAILYTFSVWNCFLLLSPGQPDLKNIVGYHMTIKTTSFLLLNFIKYKLLQNPCRAARSMLITCYSFVTKHTIVGSVLRFRVLD